MIHPALHCVKSRIVEVLNGAREGSGAHVQLIPLGLAEELLMRLALAMKSYDKIRSMLEAEVEEGMTRHEAETLHWHHSGAALAKAIDRYRRIDQPSRLVNRLAAHHRAHDLEVLDLVLIHREKIVRQHDEVRQLARRDRSFDRFLM